MEEYSVATGKGYGKMLIEIFTKCLLIWCATLGATFLNLMLALWTYYFRSGRREYINEHFGVKGFFRNDVRDCGRDNTVWFLLLIPPLNILLSFGCFLVMFTDLGDDL